ncbi:5-formyltetrahydrofolate cyclo-ligase [Rhodothermus profundi]|uniref:5-formyltetrahydrofolate cyclo-ligase n=1 Tax=Rhodothermus profundi TaxID=633813 RepID=A0A1M6PN57_9BACT|nr:5-formyltetrahydrofolate cyclo-ligase [Rhodothermus profundi]SHK09396.1 5-formyltetrahydrofolate cyclo-ligase [Rhodothermus profundi]
MFNDHAARLTMSLDTLPVQIKETLRKQFREFRASLSREAHQKRSRAIVRQLQALPELQQARSVLLYWPLLERREIDLRPLAEWLRRRNVQVALPVVAGTHPPVLEARRFDDPSQLVDGPWGLQEPRMAPLVPPETLDVVLVPALGVGRNGYRIGYGKGYYDTFLRHLTARTICPVYMECLVDVVPPEPHDVPVQVVVTEQEVIRRS